jgi:hypothetical protein
VHAFLGQAWAAKHDPAKMKEHFDLAFAGAHDTAEQVDVQDFVNAIGAGE